MYRTLFIAPPPATVKAALSLLGFEVGGVRLPLVEVDESELAQVRRMVDVAAARAPRLSGTLRVLPLGGLGEIGKNMTVVEYDGRIVVVDTGLMFPTTEMLGIDLVLPDFTYLREHAEDIEAIVLTHGHEDHVGALPWMLRELGPEIRPPIYGGRADGRDGALEDRGAQAQERAVRRRGARASTSRPGPFDLELIHVSHSIPDACAVAAHVRARHDDHHRRLQVRPDAGGRSADRRRAPRRAGQRGRAAAVRRLHQRRPRAARRRRRRASGRCWRRSSGARRVASW